MVLYEREKLCDSNQATLHIPSEKLFCDIGFLFIDDQFLIIITIITKAHTGEEQGVWIHGASSDTPLNAGALILALHLGQCIKKVAGTENPKSTGGFRRSVSGCGYGKFYRKADKTLQLHDIMQA